ncbi:MAG TPA: transposase [Candidatus Aminicenantes bacterium]|nr:transposase [Candidatus Aminicenantes bacterium]
MRLPRLTYPGAFHHVTSRGINGEKILAGDNDKRHFLELLARNSKLNGIRIFAFCLIDNHYHLVVENRSGRLSHFLRQLNGQYGMYYRRKTASQGYVFQNRFHSSLIQDEGYLTLAIRYVLLNPVRAGLAAVSTDYPWSSAGAYFSRRRSEWLATDLIEGLFKSRQGLAAVLRDPADAELPIIRTRFGTVIGSDDFPDKAAEKFDRRKTPADAQRKRAEDRFFEPAEKVVHEFERKHQVSLKQIDRSSHAGKRLRGELLVWLHDLAGLKYSDIGEIPFFFDLKHQSLGHLYRNAKKRGNIKVKN